MNYTQTGSNSRGFWRVLNPPEEVDLAKLAREAVELLDARIRSKNGSVNIWTELQRFSVTGFVCVKYWKT